MSVDMIVYNKKDKLASPLEWAKAITVNEFEMELDTDFVWGEFSGFLPCKYKGETAGFELFSGDISPADVPDNLDIGDRDLEVVLSTSSDFRELMTSIIAAGVLCSICEGVLLDSDSGETTEANAAIAWSKLGEKEISKEL